MARKIDWDSPLSEEDVLWLRNSGQPGMEERVQTHQGQWDAEVPEPEMGDGPGEGQPVVSTGDGPVLLLQGPVEEPNPEDADDDATDDYDSWKVPELEDEVGVRNGVEGTSQVSVTGTGKDGAVRKMDLIEGLRAWDRENPNALS